MAAATDAGASASAGDGAAAAAVGVRDFTFGRVLGEGAYGAVVLGKENRSGREFAVKMLDQVRLMKEKKQKYATTERDILLKCWGGFGGGSGGSGGSGGAAGGSGGAAAAPAVALVPHLTPQSIVQLHYTFKDERYLYYVMELAANGELLTYMRKFGALAADVVAFYAAELVTALEFLHALGIVHRDLKPENLLLNAAMHLKLTDFGTAKEIGTTREARSNSFVGTAEYVAPELVNDRTTSRASDLWALGIVIYQMIAGRPPFRGPTEFATMQLVGQARVEFPSGFPAPARDLVANLLTLDPWTRLGAGEAGSARDYAALKAHPFFAGIDWTTLHAQTPPTFRPPVSPIVFGSDSASAARQKRLVEEARPFERFLQPNETIVECGLVYKRRGRSNKKRMLLLTDTPRIFYVDPKKMSLKGEVPWSANLRPEAKNNTAWFIHTPKRTFILEDIPGNAQRWVDAINRVLDSYLESGGRGQR